MNLDLIYNYPTTYTGLKGSSFEECYMFADIPLKKTGAADVKSPKGLLFLVMAVLALFAIN